MMWIVGIIAMAIILLAGSVVIAGFAVSMAASCQTD